MSAKPGEWPRLLPTCAIPTLLLLGVLPPMHHPTLVCAPDSHQSVPYLFYQAYFRYLNTHSSPHRGLNHMLILFWLFLDWNHHGPSNKIPNPTIRRTDLPTLLMWSEINLAWKTATTEDQIYPQLSRVRTSNQTHSQQRKHIMVTSQKKNMKVRTTPIHPQI